MTSVPRVAVLGASGLIGCCIAEDLIARGWSVTAIARRFTRAQRQSLGAAAREVPVVELDAKGLASLLAQDFDVVVNCVGVLQDSWRDRTREVHEAFVGRLAGALASHARPPVLLQLSVPGDERTDATRFARTKREAERVIAAGGIPYVILRPGFVVAVPAYGGSSLLRAVAALPIDLPRDERERPFAVVAMADIAATVAFVALRASRGERSWAGSWDLMESAPTRLGAVLDTLRRHFGGPAPFFAVPAWSVRVAAILGDLCAYLGWRPAIRTTALRELRRGVAGDPGAWIAATGIEPASAARAIAQVPATVQEAWFGRLYLAKPLVIATLALFWIVSGVVGLRGGFPTATRILWPQGFAIGSLQWLVVAASCADLFIGCAIAIRPACRGALIAALLLSIAYLLSATFFAPELWRDPLGPLVKVVPSMVLALVGLAILPER